MDGTPYLSGASAPFSTPPRRVVSLVPALTESLFELGIGAVLVGITDACVYPAASVARLPRIGAPQLPDRERVLALRPDLIMADALVNQAADIAAFEAAGIVVWVTAPRTARETLNRLWDIMYAFEKPEMVERVRIIEWNCDWLERIAETQPRVCRVFAAASLGPLLPFAADSYAHDLLRVCGGTNVFADRDAALALTMDEIAAAQPDIILLPEYDPALDSTLARAFDALDCPAVRNDAIHLIDGTLLSWRGTRIARAFNDLPVLLCPQDEAQSDD